MLFNSIQFAFFFPTVFILYLLLNHRKQNLLLLAASYIFYACWDARFLGLLFLSTIVDFTCGTKIHQANNRDLQKKYLWISIFVNLFILCIFKYFNFFTNNFQSLFSLLGINLNIRSLSIVLPIGISFYTFQTMSYTIDIYNRKIKPTHNLLDFALFVAFFPQLVAGPIERAKNLLPQILKPRKLSLNKFYEGCYLIFWGLFQKIFIADNLATIVDPVFASNEAYNGTQVLLALYAFSFQIFCDFAGYSNIARGISKCLGFEIMVNFNCPYFSKNPIEFWKRWHISLSSWLKDYLYIPLGGNKNGKFQTCRNLMITMLLGGLWHGASWTFIFWGLYQGLLLIIHRSYKQLFGKTSNPRLDFIKPIIAIFKISCFYHLTCFGWLIFRAHSTDQIFQMSYALLSLFKTIHIPSFLQGLKPLLTYTSLLLLVQMEQYINNDQMLIYKTNVFVKSIFYYACLILMIILGITDAKEFIYFQF